MKPTTLMQRAFLEVGYRLVKDDLRVNVSCICVIGVIGVISVIGLFRGYLEVI